MTKILLKFSDRQVNQPITSKVILDLEVQLNILYANVTPQGGEILLEAQSRDIDEVVQAFKKRGVVVDVQKGVEVDGEKCINCGGCYSVCPVDAISFQKGYLVVFNEGKCISCGLCVNTCPTRAIRI
jgi:NAD-dependent dihydropyrimidine dehydrogenase PreA subunit